MGPLERVADRQAVLSATANRLKARVDQARWSVLGLSIAGAFAAAIAAALPGPQHSRLAITTIGAILLAVAAAISNRYLSSEAVRRHVRARAASEALKREAFLHAAGSSPYADATTADTVLAEAWSEIDANVADLASFEAPPLGKGSCPRAPIDRDAYVDRRIEGQIAFYRDRASRFGRMSGRLRFLEWMLALLASLITAAAGLLPKSHFDLAAMTGVLTTIAGAILSHVEASRYDELVISYRGAASRLEHLLATMKPNETVASIAQRAEAVVAAETGSWHGMFSR